MDSILYRYRNITVLLVALFGQLIVLAWQVRSENEVPLVRFWAITAVTPVASAIENARNGTTGFFGNYFALRDAHQQSRKLKSEVDRLSLENQLLKNDLASAQRVETMAGFQAHTPSKMIGARVIGATTGTGAKSLLLDRGTSAGVHKGMAVVTPAGIVGKILAVYPFASQVLSVSDPGFAAGVESQKTHVRGVLKGVGTGSARVDYIPTGQKVEVGDLFFTSGEDRVFPKGLMVGRVTGVREGGNFQDIVVQPSGSEAAPEEVLIVVDPAHQEIPDTPPSDSPVFLAPPLNGAVAGQLGPAPASGTQADKLMDQYKKLGEAQRYTYGEGGPGSLPINFNAKVPGVNAPAAAGTTGTTGHPGATGTTGSTGTLVRPRAPVVVAPGAATGIAGGTGGVPGPRPTGIPGVTGMSGSTGVRAPLVPRPAAPKPPPVSDPPKGTTPQP
jgi:rod shape-determining protein MreC